MEERRNKPEFEKSPKKWRYNFSKALFTFWKTVKMYGGENERIDEEITFFRKVLDFFFEEKDEISILFDGIDIKVDKVRIRGQRQDDKYFEDVYDLFLSLCMAGITFKKGVTDQEILKLFRVIGKYPVGREPKVPAFERVKNDLPDLDKIEIFPYDPEESGNLPIYTVPQKVRKIYRTLAAEYHEYKKMVDAIENIPLRIIERNVQDLISILRNSKDQKVHDMILMLISVPNYRGTFKGASAAARTILSVMVSNQLGFDAPTMKRTAIAGYFQYFSSDINKGYTALSRMDEFNYSRIEAALNTAYRISDFSDEGIKKPGTTCGTVSGDVLKVVSYFDNTTKKWPERVKYSGPTQTRHEAIRNILKNTKNGAFRREIADALVSVTGIYPPGNILKIISTDQFCISGGKFDNFSSESQVFVLDKDLSILETKNVKAENLVDVPESGGTVLPSKTWVQMFSYFLNDSETDQ